MAVVAKVTGGVSGSAVLQTEIMSHNGRQSEKGREDNESATKLPSFVSHDNSNPCKSHLLSLSQNAKPQLPITQFVPHIYQTHSQTPIHVLVHTSEEKKIEFHFSKN